MSGYDKLSEYVNYANETPFDFVKKSSIGCGGTAKVGFYPKTVEETAELLKRLQADRIDFVVVGNMTNVLPPDGAFEKVVVCIKSLKGIFETPTGVSVAAGVMSGELLKACKTLKKSGAEFLEGIPCTVGGALFMNAGVGGAYIGEIVKSVTVFRKGKIEVLQKADCEYSYKSSVFMHSDDVILGANLRLDFASEAEITRKIKYFRDRRAHLPKGKSMGCVFKNPEGFVAGKLIEGAGLKGLRVGGAFVSERHANFIINDGSATAAQIKSLIQIIKNAVFAQYKIRLEEEIRYLS
ncbi:MAG: UDP-N-acetylmuramate dehydrogenase [Clostridia bacterium]|nr:UDP-N-acetylmuramate dehydrogenase [Clostridia bacterium]